MVQLEREIEAKLRKGVEDLGGRCLKWTSASSAGVPDRIVLLPGGRLYFVETKRPKGGRLSPLQKVWSRWLQDLGFSYSVVWTLADLADFLQKIKS